jgi:hypothetical protein
MSHHKNSNNDTRTVVDVPPPPVGSSWPVRQSVPYPILGLPIDDDNDGTIISPA